ncbi:acidic mammalian chitinase-like [Schistocerca gregaria]|uniref:acidic mammalian chitinase-like n=1 Tax=Schistocerca gregaria TaxID=7010 RepID=UPI00211E3507|nr:acidic mammalian chitinase-like [Schistocerca gregaria]
MRYDPLILFLLATFTISTVLTTGGVVCYVGTWANYRTGNGNYSIPNIGENLDVDLCDHIIYTFVGLEEATGKVISLDPWLDLGTGTGGTGLRGFCTFTDLKQKNPNLRASLAVGGWNEGSSKYSTMVNDPAKRKIFIDSAVEMMKEYNFDGFDLDWEYPNQRGGNPVDAENFNTLIREFREEFDKYGFFLTAAVASAPESVDLSYDVPSLSKYLDRIHVMTYDLHGPWDGVTGINAPMYGSSVYSNNETLAGLYVDNCIRGWLNRGADPEKLALGMPTYGKTFVLSDPSNYGIGAPTQPGNGGPAGPHTKQDGMLGYNEYCEFKSTDGWQEVWDDEQQGVYAYKSNGEWIGFDNEKSLCMKGKYAKDLKLGSTMIWSSETDDFRGICGGKKNPLTAAIKDGISSNPTLC